MRYRAAGSAVGSRLTASIGWWIDGFPFPAFCILILWNALTPLIQGGSRMRESARTVLCGGCWVTGIPTATASHFGTNCLSPVVHVVPNSCRHLPPVLGWFPSPLRLVVMIRCPKAANSTPRERMSPFSILGLPVSSRTRRASAQRGSSFKARSDGRSGCCGTPPY